MSARAVLAPVADAVGTRLGRKLFRKQVLRQGEIDYKGHKINFDRDYLVELANAFNQGAYDQVAFLVADKDNSHTLDPERVRGEVTSLLVTPEGLDAFVSLSEAGAKLVEENPKLGVSARIVEDLTHSDGRSFKRAIQHVLGTLDPRVTGMSPWQAVQLAADDIPVVDLSAATYQTGGPKMADTQISDEELAKLRAILKERDDVLQKPPKAEADELTPEEEAEAEAALAALNAPEPVGTALTAEQAEAIELAHQQNIELSRRLQTVEAERNQERWQRERQELLAKGIPYAVVELAEPVLNGASKTIDLANQTAESVRAANAEVMRKVLAEYPTIDLGRELGAAHPAASGPADDDKTAMEMVKQHGLELGLPGFVTHQNGNGTGGN